jgi:HEAT repeat protein
MIPVLFDGVIPIAPSPYVVLRRGDYRLFFLKPQNDTSGKYVMVDEWFGQLPISRLLAAPTSDADPLRQLELDLKAGLQDADHDRLLDSIRMLGNMRHLQSTAELLALLDSPDALVRTYVYEALLRLHDYSVLPAVEEWLETQPEPPHELLLPRDALLRMQFRLTSEIALIRDPATIPVLVRLLHLPSSVMRGQVLQALRAIHSPQSAPSLLQMLDDPDVDNGFGAMQALIELAGGGVIDWIPSWPEFRKNPTYYAARCREWWQTEGQHKAAH